MSERIALGEIEALIVDEGGGEYEEVVVGIHAVALDMSKTSIGRTYFPSDWV